MFAGVAVLGLAAATRMIETRNLRLEEIALMAPVAAIRRRAFRADAAA